MGQEGEIAMITKEKMMNWAEFTYKVAIGVIAPNVRLREIPVSGIPELFDTPNLRNLTIRRLFNVHDGGNIHRRSIGSLMHMIQDSFAEGHTERRGLGTNTIAPIVSFHSYTNQDSDLHGQRDALSRRGHTNHERLENTHGALDAIEHSSNILRFYQMHRPWEEVRDFLNSYVFVLENPNAEARAGSEFMRH